MEKESWKSVKIAQVLDLEPNYRLLLAKNDVLARMYLEKKKMRATPGRIETLVKAIEEKGNMLGVILEAIRDYTGELLSECRVFQYHNKIPAVVRNQLAQLIAGVTITPTLKANYLALGNGATAPADGDTTLQSELVRGLFTQRSATWNVAYLDKFWWSSEVGGLTILEVGTFIDGTAWANTWYLLSRVAVNVVVGALETLSVNVAITLTSAT